MIDQELEQKKQTALDKGATLEEVEMIAPGSPGVEGVDYQVGSEDDALAIEASMMDANYFDDESDDYYTFESPPIGTVPWSRPAALQYTQKLQAAVGLTEDQRFQIYSDLISSGKSPLASELNESLIESDRKLKISTIGDVANEVGPEAATSVLKNDLESNNEYVLEDAAIASLSGTASNEDQFLQAWEEESIKREEFKREFAEHIKFTGSVGGDVLEFVETMTPFVNQRVVQKLANRLIERFDAPLDSSASVFILEGNYTEDIRDWITSLDTDEQKEVFEFLTSEIDDFSVLMKDNDFLKMDVLQKFFSGAFNEEEPEYIKHIDNLVSILDLAMVGSLIKSATKAPSYIAKSSELKTIQRIDKEKSPQITASVIDDVSGVTAESLGTTREDAIVDSLLPKWQGYADDPLVSADMVERQINYLREVQSREVDIAVHMTDMEKLQQRIQLEESLSTVKGTFLRKNESTIKKTPSGVEVDAIYSRNQDEGFNAVQFEHAKRRLNNVHPEAVVTPIATPDGIMMKVTLKDEYRAGDNVIFNMKDIFGRGAKAKYLGDISTNLSKNLSDSFYTAFDTSRGHEKLFNDMIKPFTSASNKNKKVIISILDDASKIDKELNIADLKAMLPDDISAKDAKEILEGVVSVKTMTDAAYVLENKIARQRMITDGYKHVTVGEFQAAGRPLELENLSDVTKVFNPIDNEIVSVTPKFLKQFYQSGGQIVKSKNTHGKDPRTQSSYIMVEAGKGSVNVLPQQVVNYNPNYITRLYKDQYFITGRVKSLNLDGKQLAQSDLPIKVLMSAPSKKEAEAALESLRVKHPDLEISFKNSRELTKSQNQFAQDDLKVNTGGLFFSKKGEQLKDTTGSLAQIEDPVTAIQAQSSAVSRLVEMQPVVDLMKKRFINTFGRFTGGKFPTSKEAIVNPALVRDDDVNAAKVMWDYIDMLEGGNVTSDKWRSAMIGFGEWIEDVTGSAKLGSFVRTKVSQKDPLSAARGVTFLSSIVMNPARQLFIQSQQYLFLAGLEPKLVLAGGAHKRGSALMLSMIADQKIKPEKLAKLANMDVDEFKQMSKAFSESGLTEAIDSHLLGRDAVLHAQTEITNNKLSALTQSASNLLSRSVDAVKGVGFDLGERINISMTYPVAWKRYRDKFPNADMSSKEAKFAVSADARQLTLGMTQAGAFGYQTGILSMATQFFSIQHKAMLAMMRGVPGLSKYGNKAITPQEARRIMAFQTGIYGAAGMGINSIVDGILGESGINELSPEARQILHGGVYDLLMNGMIQSVTGEDSNLSFASNLSAGQGWNESLLSYMEDIASGDVSTLEFMTGASATVASRFGTAFRTLKYAVAAPEELNEDMARDVAKEFASIFSGYRQYLSGDAMLRLGYWVNSNRGLLPIKASTTDGVIKGLLGVNDYEYDSMYKHFTDRKRVKDDLDNVAKHHFDRIMKHIGDTANETEGGFHVLRAMERAINIESHLLEALYGKGTADFYAIKSKVVDYIKQRGDTGEDDILNQLYKGIMNNTYGSEAGEMVNFLERSGLISSQDAEKARIIFNDAIGGE